MFAQLYCAEMEEYFNSLLNAATGPKDMDLPGLKLHELRGTKKGVWSVWVSGNWRITFRFNGKDAERVNYEDYH